MWESRAGTERDILVLIDNFYLLWLIASLQIRIRPPFGRSIGRPRSSLFLQVVLQFAPQGMRRAAALGPETAGGERGPSDPEGQTGPSERFPDRGGGRRYPDGNLPAWRKLFQVCATVCGVRHGIPDAAFSGARSKNSPIVNRIQREREIERETELTG